MMMMMMIIQVYISYGLITAAGVAMAQNSFMLMLGQVRVVIMMMMMMMIMMMTVSGQYFKKRREVVEVVVEASVGAGVLAMAQLLNFSVRRCGWRLGLQAVTIIMVSIFFIGQGHPS